MEVGKVDPELWEKGWLWELGLGVVINTLGETWSYILQSLSGGCLFSFKWRIMKSFSDVLIQLLMTSELERARGIRLFN